MPIDGVIVIAASRGGIRATKSILKGLPPAMPVAIVVIIHILSDRASTLAEIFQRNSALHVSEAIHSEALAPGHVYIAPPGYHTTITQDHTLALSSGPKEHHVRPSADPLFMSAAAVFRERAVGVILTGGDGDGSSGVQRIHEMGGKTIAQDEQSCEEFSMPRSAIATGCIDAILPLDAIAPYLVGLVTHPTPTAP